MRDLLLGLVRDMTQRSMVKGPTYFERRRIADLRFMDNDIQVLTRILDLKDPDAAGHTANNSATYFVVQARINDDAGRFAHLLRKIYAKQMRPSSAHREID